VQKKLSQTPLKTRWGVVGPPETRGPLLKRGERVQEKRNRQIRPHGSRGGVTTPKPNQGQGVPKAKGVKRGRDPGWCGYRGQKGTVRRNNVFFREKDSRVDRGGHDPKLKVKESH